MKLKLDTAAQEGYRAEDGAACPYYASSPNGDAWLLGAYLRRSGRAEPSDVRKGRGSIVHVRDCSYRPVDDAGRAWERIK